MKNAVQFSSFLPKLTSESVSQMVSEYSAGIKRRVLLNRYNIGKTTFYYHLDKAGIIRIQHPQWRHRLDEGFFDELGKESAYWFGFLLADGSTSGGQLKCQLQLRDVCHLERLKVGINATNPIIRRPNAKYPHAKIILSSWRMIEKLERLGWSRFKTGDPTPLIQPEMQNHVLRGFFDGDGSVFMGKRSLGVSFVCATQEIVEAVRAIIVQNIGCPFGYVAPKKNVWSIRWNGTRTARRIADWMYRDATVWLDRKRIKFGV